MGLSADKTEARLAIHERMGEPCSYSDGIDTFPTLEQIAAGLELTVRFHTKSKVSMSESDSMSLMENIEKIIFMQPQLDALGLTPDSGGVLTFPGYGLSVTLDSELDPDGPLQTYWTVIRA